MTSSGGNLEEGGGTDPFDLTGRVAVLTGSTPGMGLAAAQLFAEHGARVVLVGRNAEGCDAAAQKLNARFAEARALGRVSRIFAVGAGRTRTCLIDMT